MVSMKEIILEGLWNVASALEGQPATKILQETIPDVAKAVVAAESDGVWVD